MAVPRHPIPKGIERNLPARSAPGRHASEGARIASVSVIGPSSAWRRGVRTLVQEQLPHLTLTCYAESSPPVPDPPGTRDHAVLLDGAMDHAVILQWILFWRQIGTPAHVVVLDASYDVETLLSYLGAGIVGYTPLGEREDAIIDLLEDLDKGIIHCSPDLIAQFFTAAATPPLESPLSAREQEVLDHIARNLSNQEIANTLSIEVSTVKHHVHNILHKLDVQHRWEAVSVATSEGWLEHR